MPASLLLSRSAKLLWLSIPFLVIMIAGSRQPGIDVKPDDNRFTKSVLTEKLDEPMEMTILPNGKVLFVERKGGVKIFDPVAKELKLVATLDVNIFYVNKQGQKRPAEEGLMGVVHHPDFEKNNWIYMYYADPKDTKHVLARWELKDDKLVESSKKIILEIPTQREECCHTGGGMVFDTQGNLYLTVGNNTVNPQSGTSNLDERPGMKNSDDQRTAGNTNDLRGKILRIHPTNEGSYTIPEGNLFPKGLEKTKPEIYTMGHRNPWRPTIDSKTGFLYWGEVGPDASNDTEMGPRGYDEFNQAKKAGNFGWPYFIGDNLPYNDYDYATKKTGPAFDIQKPINNSANNTGLSELPPPQKAMIWYPYGLSEKFPILGSAGRSATGGPVYRRANFTKAKRPFPEYYEGKWFIVDFMRGWIILLSMDEKGDYQSMERFLPKESFGSAIDMDFSPDGDLYVLEYGTAWFRGNDNARLVKVEYNAGNRKPAVAIGADKTKGSVPLKVKLSSANTIDYDGDALKYEWKITGGGTTRTLKQANPMVTLDKPGTYKATLTATDAQGAKESKTLEIIAGNEPPSVSFDLLKNGNKTFYFPGDTLRYSVGVKDKEDGSIANGKIKPAQVAVTIDYLPIGYDQIETSQLQRNADLNASISTGQILIQQNDCKSCHVMDKKSVGPSYIQIAQKYKGKKDATDKLAGKIISGGSGVWGEHAMSAHPQISKTDAKYIVEYILNIGEKKTAASLPLKGIYPVKTTTDAKEKGSYILRAAYRDRGNGIAPAIIGEEMQILRYPVLDPEKADYKAGANFLMTPFKAMYMEGNNSSLGYYKIDLTRITHIIIAASTSARNSAAGGTIEVRLDSLSGTLIGQSVVEVSQKRENKTIAIPEIKGKHDVYFIFKNEKALSAQSLMQVSTIEFKSNPKP
jgi:cytochrome c